MIFKSLGNLESIDFGLLLSTILIAYVAYYYYKYFTRVNPLPGPFPLPIVGNFPEILLRFNGNAIKFFKYCHEKYGDIHEIHAGLRTIVLCRPEYLEKFLSKNAYGIRFKNMKVLEELGIAKRGLAMNNDFKSWSFNRHFFNQAILSPKFTDEVIDWTNKLFNELESYWNELFLKEEIIRENKNRLDLAEWFNHYTNDIIIRLLTGKKSYSMASYFDILSDKKSGLPSEIVEDSMNLLKELHGQVKGFTTYFVIPAFFRHYVPIFKNIADDVIKKRQLSDQKIAAFVRRRRQEIDNTPLNKPLSHDMLTSMIVKNTFRDVNYIEIDEVNRTMTDLEISANLREGIISGTLKVNFSEKFYIFNFNQNLT
jgi:hypothetical protein